MTLETLLNMFERTEHGIRLSVAGEAHCRAVATATLIQEHNEEWCRLYRDEATRLMMAYQGEAVESVVKT